jgi:hypothetical protein
MTKAQLHLLEPDGAKRFDLDNAREEFENAVDEVRKTPLPDDDFWLKRITKATDEWESKGCKTYVAMLGISIVARATDPAADLTRLKQDSSGASLYHARGLADKIAPVATLANVDLGAKGKNPLNNSPFRGPADLEEARRQVRGKNRVHYDALIELIEMVEGLSSTAARAVLQAFVQARTRNADDVLDVPPGKISFRKLVAGVEHWVGEDSEGGKRAQVAAAAFYDAAYSPERVATKAVNDPNRDFPGDVALRANGSGFRSTVEVRDKPVALSDLKEEIAKAASRPISRVDILAVANKQPDVPVELHEEYATKRGVFVRIFQDWLSFATDAVFHGTNGHGGIVDRVPARLLVRAKGLEVSKRGIKQLRDSLLALSQ